MDTLFIIYIWGILSLVIIGYVIYRFFTDRKSSEKQHWLYPLISNSTDGTFPEKGKYISWALYLFLLIGMFVFLVNLFYEVTK
jgi:hypothetical protein